MIPTIDFETYSEAGYRFDATVCYFVPLQPGKPGLMGINSSVYAEHDSTEVISLAYDLMDGAGVKLWAPWCPPPVKLFDHIIRGGLVEAHNSKFEHDIWNRHCVSKLGWPELPINQLRCSMAKARAYGLPGGLDAVAGIVGSVPKDKRGKQLIQLLSIPKKPTKADPSTRRTVDEHPGLYWEMYEYNRKDVAAEDGISRVLPDMSGFETHVFILDQQINERGVFIDQTGLGNCIRLFEQIEAERTKELIRVTSGAVNTIPEVAKLKAGDKWLQSRGFNFPSLDKNAVSDALNRPDLPSDVRRVLEIRQEMGGASVKKIYALKRYLNRDGRIRNLFKYCGAERTGRWAGRGPQPQNMKNGGPEINGEEWGNDLAEKALNDISFMTPHEISGKWGSPVDLIGSCMRSLFIAAPGCDLICSDYSAIEAVVLSAMAGEEWRLEVFRTHGKIYEMSAAMISGIPFEEIIAHKEQTGKHHPLRKKIGKIAELACFTHDTQVLTDRGFIDIVDVTKNDKLWDGEEWVKHSGVVYKGKKHVINLDGVRVTPDHPVNINGSWMEAKKLASNKNILTRALATGSESIRLLKSKYGTNKGGRCACVHAALKNGFSSPTLCRERPRGAQSAVERRRQKRMLNYTPNTPMLSRTMSTGGGLLIDYARPSTGAITKITADITTTVGGGLKCATSGAGIAVRGLFCNTSLRWKVGIILTLKWIDRTMAGGMNLGIYVSLLRGKITKINAWLATYKGALMRSKSKSKNLENVYDILRAGPRHRFTIKTDNGYLVVHNSGYAGWIGAWKNFGADEFMTDEEIKTNILKWREKSPAIVEMWGGQWRKVPGEWSFYPELYGVEGMFISALQYPGYAFGTCGLEFSYESRRDTLNLRLPSGRILYYHSPRLFPYTDQRGLTVLNIEYKGVDSYTGKWSAINTYGGKLVENCVQAVSRDILAAAMLRLDAAGYPIVMHVHDEIAAEVWEGLGSVEDFEKIMSQKEPWFSDWPIKAAGGWRGKRYRK